MIKNFMIVMPQKSWTPVEVGSFSPAIYIYLQEFIYIIPIHHKVVIDFFKINQLGAPGPW